MADLKKKHRLIVQNCNGSIFCLSGSHDAFTSRTWLSGGVGAASVPLSVKTSQKLSRWVLSETPLTWPLQHIKVVPSISNNDGERS